jgi:hypothetical protein
LEKRQVKLSEVHTPLPITLAISFENNAGDWYKLMTVPNIELDIRSRDDHFEYPIDRNHAGRFSISQHRRTATVVMGVPIPANRVTVILAALFSDAQAAIITVMAGGDAEMALLGDRPPRFMGSDLPNANGIASMVCRTTASVAALIEHCYQEALQIVEENKSVVAAFAQALIVHPNRTLNSRDRCGDWARTRCASCRRQDRAP